MIAPESARLDKRHLVEGNVLEAKERFYELAQSQVRHVDNNGMREWLESAFVQFADKNVKMEEINAVAVIAHNYDEWTPDDTEKWLRSLEIVINDSAFKINGQDFSDVMSFIVEHEVYEMWLTAKRGAGRGLTQNQRHSLARRKEYLMAVEQGKGEHLLDYHRLRAAERGEQGLRTQKECTEAFEFAKKRLEGKQQTTQE